MLDISPILIIGVIALFAVIIIVGILLKNYKLAKPNEAIIVTGRKSRDSTSDDGEQKQKVVQAGRVFVTPILEQAFHVSLKSRQIGITTVAQTKTGITIRAEGVALVKIGGSEESIRAAAQRFLGDDDKNIETSTKEVLSGALRGIIGGLTVEQLIQDRATFAGEVLKVAKETLERQGLEIDTFQIQDISDQEDYIKNLGRPQAAAILQKARIAEHQSEQASEEARIQSQSIIAEKDRLLKLQQAEIQAQTDKANAEAASARPLAEATKQQEIISQQEITEEKRARLRERQLETEVRRPAEAEAFRLKTIAEGEAASVRTEAQGHKDARIAYSEALVAEGRAQAESIEATGKAEAASTKAKSDALRDGAETLLRQDLIKVLPQIAKEYASAYGNIDNLTVISTDGANEMTKSVANGLPQILQSVKASTGVDLAQLLTGAVTGSAAGKAAAAAGQPVDDYRFEESEAVKHLAPSTDD